MTEASPALSVDRLAALVASHEIDTVVVGITDMQGRLQGKRFAAAHFLDDVMTGGTEGCNYLLAVDVEMNTVVGYAMSSWERGYGDFVMVPDLSTLRLLPWHPGTAFCVADLQWADGTPVVASPRQILQRQAERLAARGWHAPGGHRARVHRLRTTPTSRPGRPATGRSRRPTCTTSTTRSSARAGSSRCCGASATRWARRACGSSRPRASATSASTRSPSATRPRRKADEHSLFKMGAKEIAAQEGYSLTFMAKFDEREGNSCHVHLSLRDDDGRARLRRRTARHGFSPVFEQFIAGLLASLRELTLLLAPNINSYKRFVRGSFAPTALAWGHDNRTCAFRVDRARPEGLRVECRVPGGDVNPYLALAAMVAGGLHGIEEGLALEPEFVGNAYDVGQRRAFRRRLREAADLFAASAVAREAFGDEVVDHYANMARVELEAFESAVTDWERFRGFERL